MKLIDLVTGLTLLAILTGVTVQLFTVINARCILSLEKIQLLNDIYMMTNENQFPGDSRFFKSSHITNIRFSANKNDKKYSIISFNMFGSELIIYSGGSE